MALFVVVAEVEGIDPVSCSIQIEIESEEVECRVRVDIVRRRGWKIEEFCVLLYPVLFSAL